jgi:two-component system, cell cycle sensor histidine kinase and response regulator CckA
VAIRGIILLVDDEDGVRDIQAGLLREHGYEVLEASDGLEALVIIQTRGSQVTQVLCEAIMPGLDGPTLRSRAAAWLPADRFHVRSGYDGRDAAHRPY